MKMRFGAFVGTLFAVLLLGSVSAAAAPENEFQFHVGDQFLKDITGAPLGAVAKASDGKTITVIGSGEIDVKKLEADGEGTFEVRSPSGVLGVSGTWEAKKLISFQNFGGQAGVPPDFRGGRAVIRVHAIRQFAINPSAPLEFDATLTVDCALGKFPAGFEEGITFDAGFINFNKKVSGVTVFVVDE